MLLDCYPSSGAFAIVEECVYRPRGGRAQLVAVKRLKPELTRSSVDVAGMVKEAALLRKLRNSHIVEFLGFGHWDFASHGGNRQASIFIVEELVDGGSLKLIVHKQVSELHAARPRDGCHLQAPAAGASTCCGCFCECCLSF